VFQVGHYYRQEGGVDAATETRLRELQNRVEELQAYETIVRRIRPRLAEVVALVGQEALTLQARKPCAAAVIEELVDDLLAQVAS
jgi:hypothetical protein